MSIWKTSADPTFGIYQGWRQGPFMIFVVKRRVHDPGVIAAAFLIVVHNLYSINDSGSIGKSQISWDLLDNSSQGHPLLTPTDTVYKNRLGIWTNGIIFRLLDQFSHFQETKLFNDPRIFY